MDERNIFCETNKKRTSHIGQLISLLCCGDKQIFPKLTKGKKRASGPVVTEGVNVHQFTVH